MSMNNDAYAAALAEIEEGRLDKGVWARSIADSGGDESKAKALYIKARAESIQSAAVWQDTRPPATDDAGAGTAGVKVDSEGNVAPGIDGAKDFSDARPMSLYEAAIGERSRNYYLSKFEVFDEQGPGLHASWNWAAFFFTGYWALYRKMYVWFFAWWAVGTVGTILIKVPDSQFQRWVGLGYVACSLGFGAYANSFYHRKVKARIATAQKPNSDASRVSRRLTAGGGVHMWVPIGLGGLTLLGIVAAVALPAYEDYTKRQAVAASPVQVPAPVAIQYGANDKPVPDGQSRAELPNSNSDKEFLKKQGVGGNQDLTAIAAWGDAQIFARISNDSDRRKAQSFVLMWQRQMILKLRLSPERALFLGYMAVIENYDAKEGICRPNMNRNEGIEGLPDGRFVEHRECYFPE